MDASQANNPHMFHIATDAVLGLAMFGMSFLGFILTDVAAFSGRTYWLICVAVFAVMSFYIFWRHRKPDTQIWTMLGKMAVHWLGALVAIIVVFAFIDAGRIANTSAGLMGSVILGLTTYLAGVHGSWRLLAIGAAIGLGTIAVAYLNQYIWVLLGIALLAIVVLVFGDRFLPKSWRAQP